MMASGGPAAQPVRIIMVVYAAAERPTRAALADHLYSFRRYSGASTIYVNALLPWAGILAACLRPDIVIFHTSFLAQRWHPPSLDRLLRRMAPLRSAGPLKVALPQDEFIGSTQLREFVTSFRVDMVLTVAPESEWRKIYGDLVDGPTRFARVLTGYLVDAADVRLRRVDTGARRAIDIGYRAWHSEPWLGRIGRLKVEIAERVLRNPVAATMRLDISTREEDTLPGDSWWRFLAQCRWVLGVEGGASLLDADGAVKERTRAFVRANPGATFAEIERACFAGLDGDLNLVALSPRHLEACVTGTGQILVEGDYNGILVAGVHYLAVRRDFSNLDDVLAASRSDALRGRLVDAAYADIVASDLWTYRRFMAEFMEMLPPRRARPKNGAALERIASDQSVSGQWLERLGWLALSARRQRARVLDRLRRSVPTARL